MKLWKIITSCFNLFKELTTIPLSHIKQNGNSSLKKYTSKMKLMQLQVKGKENSISITGCYLHFLQVSFYCGISHRRPTAPTHWAFVGATQLTRSWVLQSTKMPPPQHNTRCTISHPSVNMRKKVISGPYTFVSHPDRRMPHRCSPQNVGSGQARGRKIFGKSAEKVWRVYGQTPFRALWGEYSQQPEEDKCIYYAEVY